MSKIASYSRFVSFMKILLPLGGGLILVGVVVWPFINSKKEERLTNIDSSSPAIVENRMLKPKYASTDEEGRPFEVEAEWSKPTVGHDEADLITPHGKISTEKHGNVIVDAKHGHFDKKTKVLQLDTDVVMDTADGYHFVTEKAAVYTQTKIVEGELPIKGHGPTGQLQSQDGFRLEETKDGNRILTLKGRSRIVIDPSTLKKVNRQ